MSEISNGGPNTWQFPGMTLRDYFAAKAMAAYISSEIDMTSEDTSLFAEEMVAQIAYLFADAMLAARASFAQPAAEPEPAEGYDNYGINGDIARYRVVREDKP